MVRLNFSLFRKLGNIKVPMVAQPSYSPNFFKSFPAIRVPIRYSNLKLSNPQGREGRINLMRDSVTKLIAEERIVKSFFTAGEVRNYAELLIAEAIRHGDNHQPTMDLANFWLHDKSLIHKLFKVIVPRYKDCKYSYTVMHKAPMVCPGNDLQYAVLELRNNPLEPVKPRMIPTRNWIHNVLLEEARHARAAEKAAHVAAQALTQETQEARDKAD